VSALADELTGIDLGDQRRDRRAEQLLEALGEKPTVSIPAACGGWDETKAAYRLFDHPAVTAERVLAPHSACTVERLREHPRVLCVQDTTELDYTSKKEIAGLGPLNYETRRGMYLHPTLALTPERVPLGLLDLDSWAREPGSLGQEKDPGRALEEKESVRWVDGFAHVNELAEQLTDTRLTYIADREGDIYDLFVEAPCPERGADWSAFSTKSVSSPTGASCAPSSMPLPCSPRLPSTNPPPMAGRHAPSISRSRRCA
jgi:hypothetical protein